MKIIVGNSLWSKEMKERKLVGFGKRLTRLRKAKGLTQTELGKKAGVTQRVIAYYEADDSQPPGAILIDLADALEITVDELLGRKKIEKPLMSAQNARLLKRLQRIEKLPTADRRAVFKILDALLAQHENQQTA
ncbi:MAG: helix-turn-helix domain-containing protein [Candidatus Rifleibacteriota bacterium]